MQLIINLTQREEVMLTAISNDADMSTEDYGENIIKNFLKGQIKGVYQKEFNKKTEEELVQIFGELN